MTLDIEDMRRELRRVVYRPGWDFTLRQSDHEGVWMRILAYVPNAYRAGEMLELGIDSPVPPAETPQQFHTWLMWRLERIECHEAREFYTVDGERPFDPHKVVA